MDRYALAAIGIIGALAFIFTRRANAAASYLYADGGYTAQPSDAPMQYGVSDEADWQLGDDWTTLIDDGPTYSGAPWLQPAPSSDPYASAYDYEIGGDVTTPSDQIWSPPPSAAPYLQIITAAETKYSIPPMLLARLLYQESRFRPDIISGAVKSSAGAIGIAQFMPATAADLGVNPYNPTDSIFAAARYLRMLFNQTGSWSLALAAYNWGIGNVLNKGIAAAPAETRNYVAEITADVGVS